MVSSFYLFLLAVMGFLLSARVAMTRRRLRIGIGDGNNREMNVAIRVFGNFIEYVPFCLLILVVWEVREAPAWSLHVFGCTILASRILHALGLSQTIGISFGRTIGMTLTYGILVFGSFILVIDRLLGRFPL